MKTSIQAISGSPQITPVERARRERARERSNKNTSSDDMVFLLAKTITGAHWSGPRFFGLTKRRGPNSGNNADA